MRTRDYYYPTPHPTVAQIAQACKDETRQVEHDGGLVVRQSQVYENGGAVLRTLYEPCTCTLYGHCAACR